VPELAAVPSPQLTLIENAVGMEVVLGSVNDPTMPANGTACVGWNAAGIAVNGATTVAVPLDVLIGAPPAAGVTETVTTYVPEVEYICEPFTEKAPTPLAVITPAVDDEPSPQSMEAA
jgi:hypothetical protein